MQHDSSVMHAGPLDYGMDALEHDAAEEAINGLAMDREMMLETLLEMVRL